MAGVEGHSGIWRNEANFAEVFLIVRVANAFLSGFRVAGVVPAAEAGRPDLAERIGRIKPVLT